MNVAEVGWIVSARTMRFSGLWVHRDKLAPLVAGLDDKVLQPVASDTEPMRYLLAHARYLEEQRTLADPALARIAARHLRDLIALVLGARRDAAVLTQGRGLRAARLQAIKSYVADHLGRTFLCVCVESAGQTRLWVNLFRNIVSM